jgi:hypothetical protein
MDSGMTEQEAEQAEKALKEYRLRRWAEADAKRVSARTQRDNAIAAARRNLTGWALRQWEADKQNKIGRFMTEDEAVGYYIGLAASKLSFALEAYGVSPEAFFALPFTEQPDFKALSGEWTAE